MSDMRADLAAHRTGDGFAWRLNDRQTIRITAADPGNDWTVTLHDDGDPTPGYWAEDIHWWVTESGWIECAGGPAAADHEDFVRFTRYDLPRAWQIVRRQLCQCGFVPRRRVHRR